MVDLIIGVSILFPLVIALILLLLQNSFFRSTIIILSSVFLVLFTILVIINTPFVSDVTQIFGFDISILIFIFDVILLLFLLFASIRYKNIISSILVILQLIPLVYFEVIVKPHVNNGSYISFINDHLSMVMLFLIFIIGSFISIFAIKYMKEFESHNNIEKTRQPYFFFVIFLFLGSMSGLVLSNNLLNMYFFWEMTTLCSFLLIGFDKSQQAIKNAFRALWMNLIGGVAFIFAIIIFYNTIGTFQIDKILNYKGSELIILPLILLAIAAFTKAAQFPFQSWLLGAMVAPTPVSALLHSSTMVKAGVYLLVRFSPLFTDTKYGYAIAMIGGFTFMAASALAISHSNAKRVLAYSTISNLGLIIATAGIGTPLAITAAVLLIIFHAVSKGLLFLCVGTIEHGIGSRDIEDMDGLISKMPFVGTLTALGMFSMILPPFGLIITKLLGIEAVANVPVVLLFLIIGSALTVFVWTKWMAKILSMSNVEEQRVENYSPFITIPLSVLTVGIITISVMIVQIYDYVVVPYIGTYWTSLPNINLGGMMLIPIFIVLLCLFLTIPVLLSKKRSFVIKSPYLCGENECEGAEFRSVSDVKQKVLIGGYYLEEVFEENRLTLIFNLLSLAFIACLFGVVI